MDFEATKIEGAHVIRQQRHQDERGYFARTFCYEEFSDQGLDCNFVQSSVSYNEHAHTLRGLHLQLPPFAENKLIRCIRGAVYDVMLDLRADSETYLHWVATKLSPDNACMVYIPHGVAHGFQTLEAGSELSYHITEFFSPEHATGVRWDDPAFKIDWPTVDSRVMSDKDQSWPDYDPKHGLSL
ncbi:MAG: dTDP-4-dehydrorhamnose 3,5-epimerase [Pseudomonadota bacterium]